MPLTPAGLLPSDRAGQDSGEEEVATAADSVFGSGLWGTTGTCVSAAEVTCAAKGPVGRLLPGRLVVGVAALQTPSPAGSVSDRVHV